MPPIGSPAIGSFVRSLTLKSTGSDVRALQQYLNSHGAIIAAAGPGSPGNETGYFGVLTVQALARFQTAHGITPANGFFGPITRAYIEMGTIAASTSSMPAVPGTSVAAGAGSTSYSRNLTLKSSGSDVQALQIFLNNHGYKISLSGPGSPGNETTYFGPLLQQALANFQTAEGISPASGYFGPVTRARIIQLNP
jgi:peptidoglycan hydrolase-like protein with peptidoglycan-binding domain